MKEVKIVRNNPESLAAPVGKYVHMTKIPRHAELYVTSGQIGTDQNGQLPEEMNDQIRNTFTNIRHVLQSEQLTADEIIKVNIWATQPIDWDFLYKEWSDLFGSDYPSMTVGYLVQLGLPEIKIEIEVWAAKV